MINSKSALWKLLFSALLVVNIATLLLPITVIIEFLKALFLSKLDVETVATWSAVILIGIVQAGCIGLALRALNRSRMQRSIILLLLPYFFVWAPLLGWIILHPLVYN